MGSMAVRRIFIAHGAPISEGHLPPSACGCTTHFLLPVLLATPQPSAVVIGGLQPPILWHGKRVGTRSYPKPQSHIPHTRFAHRQRWIFHLDCWHSSGGDQRTRGPEEIVFPLPSLIH